MNMNMPINPYPFPNMSMMQPNFNVFNKVAMAPPLYVGDLDENIHDETLHDFFSKFGPIHFVRIMRDPATGKSRGFGYVNFLYPKDADLARQFAQYEKIGRKHIRIMYKRNVRDLPPEGNVFIKNLDPNVTVKDLHNFFSQIGPVLCCKVATNNEGQSLGYGYVQFEKKEDADNCLKGLKDLKLKENELQLSAFVPKDRRPATEKKVLYFKNLPNGKSEQEIKTIIEKLTHDENGAVQFPVESLVVKKHPTEDRYSALVCYADPNHAQAVYNELKDQQITLEGCAEPIYVNFHQGRAERARDLKRNYQQVQNDTNLFVKNLRPDVTNEDVKKAFQQFGKIVSVAVKSSNSAAGQKQAAFGFIAFDNADDAKRAQAEALSVKEIKDLYLADATPYINLHQSREKRNEYLFTVRRKKMQGKMMGMDPFAGGMPPNFPTRRFQNFPPMMAGQFKPPMRGGARPQRGGWGKGAHQQRFGGQGGQQRQQQQQHMGPKPGTVQQNQAPMKKVDNKQVTRPITQPQPQPQIQQSTITVHNLRTKLQEFLQLDNEKQRQILGELLFPLIKDISGDYFAPKITGMLIDLSVLEVAEILDFLEDPQLLRERVNEAKELIMEEEPGHH